MDIGAVRGVLTLILLLAFLGLLAWLMFGTRASDFDAVARLPLEEDEEAPGAGERPAAGITAEQL